VNKRIKKNTKKKRTKKKGRKKTSRKMMPKKIKIPTLNDLTRIFLHDEAKKELKGKKIENEALLLNTKFGKVKN
jgi:hypothetical protein